ARGADDELEWRFDLRAVRLRREKFRGREDRPHHLAQIAIGRAKPGRGAVDERGWRRIADEAPHQRGRDEMSGRRVRREDVEHLLAIAHAAAGLDAVPQDDLFAIVVPARIEGEAAAVTRLLNRPAGEGASNFGDVFLRVAAVHAERVQLHQLASVIFVEPLWRVLSFCRQSRRPWNEKWLSKPSAN